jgi:protein-disulfide isomerase
MPDQQPPLTIKQQRDLKQEMKEQRRQSQARRERTKTIMTWVIVGLTVAGIVTIVILSRGGTTSTGTLAPVTADDHVYGKTDAPVVLIEYSDYQCPACGAYFPVVKALEQKYGDKLALVYRNFPLTALHQYAQIGAQAAEAAGLQGKYWEMHDLLFENQQSWSKLGSESDVKKTFADYANQLKLDTKKFSSDLTSSAVVSRVDRDVQSGNAIGINATPTFFLNGTKLTNPSGVDPFSTIIDQALAKK